MDYLNKIIVLITFLHGYCGGMENSKVPNVTFEVLKSGSCRASIPALSGIHYFGIDIEVNRQEFKGHADSANNNHFIVDFDKNRFRFNKNLNIGDWIFYKIQVERNGFNYEKKGHTEVKELLESYTQFGKLDTRFSSDPIIEDNFNGPAINNQKWIVEQRIPTYFYNNSNFYFNSYENIDETRFIKDGILYLKPVARDHVDDVLDLRDGCTSSYDKQCYHKQSRVFIVPPVKSARIISKQSFKYGKVEIRAKLPRGDWIIPVIQLQLNESNNKNEELTKLVIAYSRGNDQLCGSGEEDLGSHCLFGGPMLSKQMNTLSKKCSSASYNEDFHIYKLEVTPDKMTFSVDSIPYGEVTTKTATSHGDDSKMSDTYFNKEYFLSLGVAVGGIHDFPDHCNSGSYSKPWRNTVPNYTKTFFDARSAWLETWKADDTALKIDYVKVWDE